MKTNPKLKLSFFTILTLLILIGSTSACNLFQSTPSETPIPEPGSGDQADDPQVGAIQELSQDSGTDIDLEFQHGFPILFTGRVETQGDDPGERALAFLDAYKELYLQSDPDFDVKIRSIGGVDGEDVTLYQTYKDIPVFASEMVVSLDGSEVYATYGQLLTDIEVDTEPQVSFQQAEALARAAVESAEAVILGETQLMIFDQSLLMEADSDPQLAWRVTLGLPSNTQLFVSAHTGDVLFQYSLAQDAFDLDFKDANYTDSIACYFLSPDDQTIGDETSLSPAYSGDIDATSGYSFAFRVYDFYLTTFRRDSYNGTGGGVEVYVHASVPNAQYTGWGCDMIEFADGWVSWDVMVHEFTHGVIGNTSGLVYSNQSGALNEGFADTMASLADTDDWLLAEDRTSGMGAIRDMSNPPAFGQPDRFSNYVVMSADNGGVHTNSGILNKAAFLIADGGDHNTWTIRGIGRGQMGSLFYAVMVSLPSNASFMTTRNAMVARADAAAWLTPREACQVQNAFASVDLGEGDRDCDGIDDNLDPNVDGDFIPDDEDNCPLVANPRQEDMDHDGIGDACDNDIDGDFRANDNDNCPLVANNSQADVDRNGVGDACQDTDFDGVIDGGDNCPLVSNPRQEDMDGDRVGDACDPNIDGDAWDNDEDLCPRIATTTALDSDEDGVGDPCDICPTVYDPDQGDIDGDGIGDACDTDRDGDGLDNDHDNCPQDYNPEQWDQDGNGIGQACDEDENLTRWGIELPFDLFGRPGWLTRTPIPLCLADCPDYFSPDYVVNFELGGFSNLVKFWITDDVGRTVGTPAGLGDDVQLISFKPFGGRHYFLNFAFSPDFPDGGQENGSMSMYSTSAAAPEDEDGQGDENEPTPTFTPTAVPGADVKYWAEPEEIDAGACFNLYWEVENVESVVFGGQEQEFSGSYHDCICETLTFPLTVTYEEGTTERFLQTILVNGSCATPTPPPTNTPVPPSPPAAPTGLAASTSVCSAADYAVTLTWKDNAGNENGYRIYRDGNLIATVGANETMYVDHPPYSGPHNYYVQAFNNAGTSNSNQASDQGCVY
jgi:Zn-dependent metalloprotease